MKPSCDVHKSPLRWSKPHGAWVCLKGVYDKTCKPWHREYPAPEPRGVTPRRSGSFTRALRDGREICFGQDWERRKYEVWLRDGKRCVECSKLLPNFHANRHTDHIRTRGMGGAYRDDRPENLRTVCDSCHRKRHQAANGFAIARTLYGPVKPTAVQLTVGDFCLTAG